MPKLRVISPFNNNGSCSIRFRHEGKRYLFTPIPKARFDNEADYAKVFLICQAISKDISENSFDSSLDLYRLDLKGNKSQQTKTKKVFSFFIDLWNDYIESLDLPPETYNNHYRLTENMIFDCNPRISNPNWIRQYKAKLSQTTINKRISVCKGCYQWGIDTGRIEGINPYTRFKVKSTKKSNRNTRPFTKKQTKLIIEAYENDTYWNPDLGTRHSYYHPLILFLFHTGVRTGEALALEWSSVNFRESKVTISQTYSTNRAKHNSSDKIIKETKTNNIRSIPLNKPVYNALYALQVNQTKKSNFVFLSPNGKMINANNLRNRSWKHILEALSIEYRPIYNTRHTFLTRCCQNPKIGFLGAAKLAGHANTTMVIRNYSEFVENLSVPDDIY